MERRLLLESNVGTSSSSSSSTPSGGGGFEAAVMKRLDNIDSNMYKGRDENRDGFDEASKDRKTSNM